MDNQHQLIKGYRDLSAEEIALINEIKAHAQATQDLIMKVELHTHAQFKATQPVYKEPETEAEEMFGTGLADTPEEMDRKDIEGKRLEAAQPFRWTGIAKTNIQQGYMALIRSVAQPEGF